MIIKKFQGKTEEEALEIAKKELGNAIVIMNVRNVKRKGFFSFFRSQLTEVTVALEEEAVSQGAIPSQDTQKLAKQDEDFRSAVAAVSQIAKAQLKEEDGFSQRDASNANDSMQNMSQQNSMQQKLSTNSTTGNKNDSSDIKHMSQDEKTSEKNDREIGEKLDYLQDLLKKQMTLPEEKDASDENKEEDSDNSNVAFYKLLYQIMLENEIDEKYVNQLIDDLDKSMKPNMPIDFMLSNIYQKMVLKFGQTSFITPAEKGPKFVFFIGPTGVGKTTTIAKIASKFSVDEKKKVALLTADTYRIAAAEQLRTYANILEVPFRVIYTAPEVEKALADFHDCDYILVDTAGHSHHNESQRNAMSEFVHALDYKVDKEVYLVVSATTKYRDLISIADTYKEMTDYKLIFTKLDETTTLGNLLNLRLHTGAQMSYITCGQNVPDDIDQFNAQETVKMLLGGNHF